MLVNFSKLKEIIFDVYKDYWTWETKINPHLDIKDINKQRNPNFATHRPFLEKLLMNSIQ